MPLAYLNRYRFTLPTATADTLNEVQVFYSRCQHTCRYMTVNVGPRHLTGNHDCKKFAAAYERFHCGTSAEVQQVFLLRQQIRRFQNRTLATIHTLLNAVLHVVPVLYNLMTVTVMMRDDEKI